MGWEYDGNRSLLSYFASSHDVTPAFLLFVLLPLLLLPSCSCSSALPSCSYHHTPALCHSYPPIIPMFIVLLSYSHAHASAVLLQFSNPPEFVQFPSFLFSTPHSPALLLSHSPAVLFLLLSAYSPTPALLTTHSPIPTLLLLLSYSWFHTRTLLLLLFYSFAVIRILPALSLLFHWITLLFLLFPNYSLTPTLPPTLLFLSFKE